MPEADIHVGDVGTKFLATIKDEDGNVVDVSSAQAGTDDLLMKFKKPDGTIVEKQAQFETDGTDGLIYYITSDGDLDQAGNWQRQGFVRLSATKEWNTDIQGFEVEGNMG